jgi:hypothetical protein
MQPRCKGLSYGRGEGGGAVLALLALAVHTSPPHGAQHPLELRVNGGPVPEGDRELRLLCTNGTCAHQREFTYRVPLEMAAACAIAFHAIHEGHSFSMWLDGALIHPPEGGPK